MKSKSYCLHFHRRSGLASLCVIAIVTLMAGGATTLLAQQQRETVVVEKPAVVVIESTSTSVTESSDTEAGQVVELQFTADGEPPAVEQRRIRYIATAKVDDEEEPAPTTERRTWLGVAMQPVEDSLREYLELPEGFGVLIEHVVDGSPAAKAGLKAKDIVMKLDEQRLTTSEHLQVLVATYKEGAEVELTVIRKGREQKVKVTLGEADLPPLSRARKVGQNEPMTIEGARLVPVPPVTVQVVPKVAPVAPVQTPSVLNHEEIQKRIAEYRTKMEKWMKQDARTRGPAPTLDIGKPGTSRLRVRPAPGKPADKDAKQPSAKSGTESTTHDAEVRLSGSGGEVRVTGGPSISIGPGASIVASGSSGGVVRINNPNGSVTIKSKEGESIIEITDAEGEVVHSGPYKQSDDMLERLPEKAQAVLKKMNLSNLEMLNIQVGPRGSRGKADDASAGGGEGKGKGRDKGRQPEAETKAKDKKQKGQNAPSPE